MEPHYRGTRVVALPRSSSAETAPDHPSQALPQGTQPGSMLRDCGTCAEAQLCLLRQRLNYRLRIFVFTFMHPECEDALTGRVDLYELLRMRPRTIAELARLTGKCYGTLWRELRLLNDQGVAVIAYGQHNESIYGIGPRAHGVCVENRRRIIELLRQAPTTAPQLHQATGLHVATIRKLLRELERTGQIYSQGRQDFRTLRGAIRHAPLWYVRDD